jgi:tetratricopeptide (TPR) repeat protein
MFTDKEVKELTDKSVQKSADLFRQNKLNGSSLLAQQVLRVDPKNIGALQILGLIEYKQKNAEKALEIFKQALEIDNTNSETHNNIALCYGALCSYDKAIEHLQATNNEDHVKYGNLANQYRKKRNFDESIKHFNKALSIENDPHLWVGLGGVYGEMNKMEQAIDCFKNALEIDPNFRPAHVDLSFAYHLSGQWDKAWEEYEYRHEYFAQFEKWNRIYSPEKRWTGDPLNGKKLVVYCEQGWGDIFNFLRFVPKDAILDVPVQIRSLLNKNGYITGRPEEYDYHCSMMSLPYLLHISKEKAWQGTYIRSSLKANLEEYSGIKIGIVWAGGPKHPRDRTRSCPLKYFEPLSKIPNVHLFSLQKDLRVRHYPGYGSIDLAEKVNFKLVDMSKFLDDWEKTAAIIDQMDVVVTVDTAILHLAGAMGKKVFAMIAYNPDWRWGLSGKFTHWYPSVHIFRQSEYDNWKPVIQSIFKSLLGEYFS